jgi:hypothetical protein
VRHDISDDFNDALSAEFGSPRRDAATFPRRFESL